MTSMKLVIAAALVSAAALAPTLAQAQAAISELGAYQAANPDRDALNGGQLTPWGREIRAQQYSGASAAFASQGVPSTGAPVVHPRRRQQ